MATESAQIFCKQCQRPVLGQRQGVNHVLHFLITIFTCGFWVVVWGCLVLLKGPFRCAQCGTAG